MRGSYETAEQPRGLRVGGRLEEYNTVLIGIDWPVIPPLYVHQSSNLWRAVGTALKAFGRPQLTTSADNKLPVRIWTIFLVIGL